jgi:hypothetical protein
MRPRISIRAVMALVVFVTVAFAALRDASDLWASLLFTLAIGLLGVATLGAMICRGRSRAFYAGTSFFGGGYLLLCCGPWPDTSTQSRLATSELLDSLYARINPGEPRAYTVMKPVRQTQSMATTYTVMRPVKQTQSKEVTYTVMQPVAASRPNRSSFHRIGHSLFALLLALFGGVTAHYFQATRDRRE